LEEDGLELASAVDEIVSAIKTAATEVHRRGGLFFLAGHNSYAYDFPMVYALLTDAGLDAYTVLRDAGVDGIMDTLVEARQLTWNKKPTNANTGKDSLSLGSVYVSPEVQVEPTPFVAHTALADAKATTVVGSSGKFTAFRVLHPMRFAVSLEQAVQRFRCLRTQHRRAAAAKGESEKSATGDEVGSLVLAFAEKAQPGQTVFIDPQADLNAVSVKQAGFFRSVMYEAAKMAGVQANKTAGATVAKGFEGITLSL
jgi:hypothetical protein